MLDLAEVCEKHELCYHNEIYLHKVIGLWETAFPQLSLRLFDLICEKKQHIWAKCNFIIIFRFPHKKSQTVCIFGFLSLSQYLCLYSWVEGTDKKAQSWWWSAMDLPLLPLGGWEENWCKRMLRIEKSVQSFQWLYLYKRTERAYE